METLEKVSEITISNQEIFNTYSKKIMGMCLRYISNKSDAEKVLEHSFIELFKSTHENYEDAIKKITILNIINHLLNSNEVTEPIAKFVTTEELNQNNLVRLLYNLPVSKRIVFNLHAIDDYSFQEISEFLNISVSDLALEYEEAKSIIGIKFN